MRRFTSIILALVMLACTMIVPASATEQDICKDVEIIHTAYGDFEVETTLFVYDSPLRSNTKSADKTHTVKYDGAVVAEVTLSASFSYDGTTTAKVVSASSSHSTSNGWSYKSESISKSGGTAKLTAKLTKLLTGEIPISISITCSPSGQIS